MTIYYLYYILPVLIIYTDRLPETVGGRANGPVVRIKTKYRGTDEGILQHELTHVRQWYRSLTLHAFLYLLVPAYRLAAEVEAYRVQARYYDDDRLPAFAGYIADNYGLRISRQAALTLLRE